MLKAGTILGNRYEIISSIGSGGMADVYKAKCNVLKRLVAIKVLKAEYSEDANFVARFHREAEAAAGLNQPNIVSVYDVGEDDGMHYIVMELVDGVTLERYIARKGKLTEREAIEVGMQVAKGLEAAHAQGIIHRDIKPQNIIISREGKIKVADFGIARVSSSQTLTDNSMGSVHYISPEQAKGGYCDERSDIYSLGISLYEMLTGRLPYTGESSVAVALQHIQNEITPPSTYAPEINANLEKIVLKCTQKNPENRYASMTALLEDFKQLLVDPNGDFVALPEAAAGPAAMSMKGGHKTTADARNSYSAGEAQNIADAADWDDEETMTQHEEDLLEEQKAKKVENALSYTLLGIAILILVVIIALVFKACAVFKDDETTPAQTTTAVVPGSSESTAAPSTEESSSETEESTTEENLEVELPDMRGKYYVDAATELEDMGLVVEYEVGSSTYDAFYVYDQSYPEGTILQKGTHVTLWVTAESGNAVIIPSNIVDLSPAEATQKLNALGLKVSSTYNYDFHDYVVSGRVMDTVPSVGTVMDKGETVKLVISKGPNGTEMPDLVGQQLEDAVKQLKALGFGGLTPDSARLMKLIVEEVNSDKPAGEVLEQSIEQGSFTTFSNSALTLKVSKGLAKLPAVEGLTREEAVLKLTDELPDAGLIIADEDILEYHETLAEGLVIRMVRTDDPETVIDPEAGAEPGTSVTLVISKGAEPETEPSTEPSSETEPETTESAEETTEPQSETVKIDGPVVGLTRGEVFYLLESVHMNVTEMGDGSYVDTDKVIRVVYQGTDTDVDFSNPIPVNSNLTLICEHAEPAA